MGGTLLTPPSVYSGRGSSLAPRLSSSPGYVSATRTQLATPSAGVSSCNLGCGDLPQCAGCCNRVRTAGFGQARRVGLSGEDAEDCAAEFLVHMLAPSRISRTRHALELG